MGYTVDMAARGKTIAVWAGAVAVAAGLACWLLSLAAASAVRQRIVAEAAERYGAQAEVGRVSVRLLPGRVSIGPIALIRPDAEGTAARVLSADRVTAWGALPGLLADGERRIRRLEAEGLSVAVERTAEHGARIVALTRPPRPKRAQPVAAPAAAPGNAPRMPDSAATPARANARKVSYRVERLDARGVVRFVDTSLRDGPFAADLAVRLEGTDLRWQRGRPADRGSLRLTGHAAADPAAWAIAVEADARPPAESGWSFEATGTVSNARPALAAPYFESAGVACSNLDIRIGLSCRAGRFESEHSSVGLAMRQVSLSGKQARRTGIEGTLLDAVTLDVPVSGDLSKPEFNLTYALLAALTGHGGGPAAAEVGDQLLKHAGRAAASALGKWLGSGSRHTAPTNAARPSAPSAQPPTSPSAD